MALFAYTFITPTGEKVALRFDSRAEAKKYAESKGWNPDWVYTGDFVAYPDSGYPSTSDDPAFDPNKSESGDVKRGREWKEQQQTGGGGGESPTGSYTDQQRASYESYLALLGRKWYSHIPRVGIDEFFSREGELYGLVQQGYAEQVREYNAWKSYASKYGGLTDWYPVNMEDWVTHYDRAQGELKGWLKAHGEWEEWRAGEDEWQQKQRQRQEEQWEHGLDPEEAARRREESYAEGRYAAQERYHEQPMYNQTFAKWMDDQRGFSGALSEFVESQYPSLRAQFEAGVGREVGYSTREEARASASARESAFEGWLGRATPALYQDYMSQRPSARDERYREYSPTLRSVSW